MVKEYVKGALAIIVVGGAVVSAYTIVDASDKLIPLASFVLGYYFKDVEGVMVAGFKKFIAK